MRRIGISILVTASFSLFAANGPAVAQNISFDPGAVRSACSGDTCSDAVLAAVSAIQGSGLAAAQMNEQLGVLAAVLVQVAQTTPSARQSVARELSRVATVSTDRAQRSTIERVATRVADASNDIGTIETSSPIGASPG